MSKLKKDFSCDNYIFYACLLLFGGTIFIFSNKFVETNTLPQVYWFLTSSVFFIIPNSRLIISAFSKNNFDKLIFILTVFTLYLILQILFSNSNYLDIYIVICCLLLFILFRNIPNDISLSIEKIFILFVNALILYTVIGNWLHLPLIYDEEVAYASILVIGYSFNLFYIAQSKNKERIVLIISLIIIITAVFFSKSRTGIITIVCTSIYYIWKNKIIVINKKIILLTVIFFAYIVFLNINSFYGRFLIWIVSFRMILDNPLTGVGHNQFVKNYMNYQAETFRSTDNYDSFRLIADNTQFAFNECIEFTCKYGIIGFVIALLILIYIINNGNKGSVQNFV